MTVGPSVRKLLEISSPPSAPDGFVPEGQTRILRELSEMLIEKNGFYAFESALFVRSYDGIQAWNERGLWRESYSGLADGIVFFAEDIFGGQFGIRGEQVVSFDPETADVEVLSSSLEDWAKEILNEYPVLTGYPLAEEWQEEHGRLSPGMRLVPKLPFVAGGDFSVRNLYELNDVAGMRLRGDIARQIHDAPEGAELKIKIVD